MTPQILHLEVDLTSYRVSLTSVFSKLMERVIVTNLLNYLSLHKLISKSSTVSWLEDLPPVICWESLNDWSLCVENGKRQQVAYIDFAKAFDSVCHNKLIAKLRMHGICGSLLQ